MILCVPSDVLIVPGLAALRGEHGERSVSFCVHRHTFNSQQLGAGRGRGDGWRQEKEGELQLNLPISC